MFDRKEYMKQYYIKNEERLKEYHKKYHKKYYIKNKEKNIEYIKKYRFENKEERKEYNKQWKKDNPRKVKESYNRWRIKKLKINVRFNLNKKIRHAIYKSLKGNKDNRRWEGIVGYTLNDLVKRLKFTMPKGYTWKDYLSGKLQIDHKIPISVFNFTSPEHTDFKRCWALKNLRLLSTEKNRKKGDKIDKPFQPSLTI